MMSPQSGVIYCVSVRATVECGIENYFYNHLRKHFSDSKVAELIGEYKL